MKAYPVPLTFLSLLFSVIAVSQKPKSGFSPVDSFAATVKYRGNLVSLTKDLTDPYSEQLFKARAIFKWITENIKYDYKYYNRHGYEGAETKTFKCKDDADCEAKIENYEYYQVGTRGGRNMGCGRLYQRQ